MLKKNAKLIVVISVILCLVSCSNDQDAPVDRMIDTAGFLRTIEVLNSDLVLGNIEDAFELHVEAADGQNGSLVENIEVFARFKENASTTLNDAGPEALVKTISKENFSEGPDGLPRTILNVSYAELLAATNAANLSCGNQFVIRLNLNLTNGKSFSVNEGNTPSIVGADTTFSSPFCYTVNIVNPIADDLFIGMYSYESVTDGAFGPTFGAPKTVELLRGNSVNERYFLGDFIASRSNEPSRIFRFVFSCDEVLFRKNQISSFFTWCPEGNLDGGFTFGGPPVLLGPASDKGIISENGDAFFELSISEGYNGWDGECGFGTQDAKVRFTKI